MFGPLVAVVGIGLLVLVARWAMRRGGSLVANPGRETDDVGRAREIVDA